MHSGKSFLLTSFFVFTIFIICSYYFNSSWNREEKTCTVTEKIAYMERDTNQIAYTIFTSCGTFALRNDPFANFYSASDLYGKLLAGKTYKLVVGGYAVPTAGRFKNIVEVTETE